MRDGFFLSVFNFHQGAIFSVLFSVDSPYLLAIGGSKGKLEVSGKTNASGFAICFAFALLMPSLNQ